MGKVLCGASSKAGGKGVTSTVPSMEEQTPQASSVEEGKWVLFLSEKELEKVRCTENCSKRSEVSGRRRQVVRLCPGLPMLLTRAIRTHHSVDCASCYLALSTKLGLMWWDVTVKPPLGGEEKGKRCVKRHPWVLPRTTLVPSPPEGSRWFSLCFPSTGAVPGWNCRVLYYKSHGCCLSLSKLYLSTHRHTQTIYIYLFLLWQFYRTNTALDDTHGEFEKVQEM